MYIYIYIYITIYIYFLGSCAAEQFIALNLNYNDLTVRSLAMMVQDSSQMTALFTDSSELDFRLLNKSSIEFRIEHPPAASMGKKMKNVGMPRVEQQFSTENTQIGWLIR